jgi:hypothetical protein
MVAARERQVLVDHVLHVGDVLLHRLLALGRARQGQLQLQPGEGRAQVVADGGQKRRALVDVALDALAHVEEGPRRLSNLACAVRLEGHVRALAEGLRRRRQPLDGPHLVADEEDGHRGQQDGGAGQPQDEDVRPAGRGPVYRRDHPQDALVHLHPHVHVGGIARGVEPEGVVEPVLERSLERAVQSPEAEQREALARREGAVLLQHDGQVQRPLGPGRDAPELARVLLIAFHRPGDVAGEPLAQAARHRLPVGVEEDPGHRRLHEGDRQDDDQQRPAVERRRQPALQPKAPAPPRGRRPVRPGRRRGRAKIQLNPGRRLGGGGPWRLGARWKRHQSGDSI